MHEHIWLEQYTRELVSHRLFEAEQARLANQLPRPPRRTWRPLVASALRAMAARLDDQPATIPERRLVPAR